MTIDDKIIKNWITGEKYTVKEDYENKLVEQKDQIIKTAETIHKLKFEERVLTDSLERLSSEEGRKLFKESQKIRYLEDAYSSSRTWRVRLDKLSRNRALKPIYSPKGEFQQGSKISGYGAAWEKKKAKILEKRFNEHKGEYCQIGGATVKLDGITLAEHDNGFVEVWIRGLALEHKRLNQTGNWYNSIISNTKLPMGKTIDCIDPTVAETLDENWKDL